MQLSADFLCAQIVVLTLIIGYWYFFNFVCSSADTFLSIELRYVSHTIIFALLAFCLLLIWKMLIVYFLSWKLLWENAVHYDFGNKSDFYDFMWFPLLTSLNWSLLMLLAGFFDVGSGIFLQFLFHLHSNK